MLRRRYDINPTSTTTISHSNINYSSSSSEDEEERLNREEEEQERQLSELHGEANEGRGSTKKKAQTDAEIANELQNNDADQKEQKERKKRPVLTETLLTGPKGLIKIRHEFSSKVRYSKPIIPSKKSKRNISKRKRMEMEIQAAASYTSKLMKFYHTFAMDLMPTEHPTDTLHKIHDLGSKKQVKNYINTMRLEVCKEHLGGIHGEERTKSFFHELDHGLQVHKRQLFDGDEGDLMQDDEQDGDDEQQQVKNKLKPTTPSKKVTAPIKSANANNYNDDDEDEMEFEDEPQPPTKNESEVESDNESEKETVSIGRGKNNDTIDVSSFSSKKGDVVDADCGDKSLKNRNDSSQVGDEADEGEKEMDFGEDIVIDRTQEKNDCDENLSQDDDCQDKDQSETQTLVPTQDTLVFDSTQDSVSNDVPKAPDSSQNLSETQTLIPSQTQDTLIFDSTQGTQNQSEMEKRVSAILDSSQLSQFDESPCSQVEDDEQKHELFDEKTQDTMIVEKTLTHSTLKSQDY